MAAAAKPRRKVGKKTNLPAPLPVGFSVVDIFKNKWVIGEKLGSGGCGVVYLASDKPSSKNYDYVMKVEFHENGPLYTELHFYRNIGKPEHISAWERKKKMDYLGMSACHGLGSFEHNSVKYRFLVLQRYGTDLQQYLDENRVFSLKTAYTVGVAVINVLEYLHDCGYIHGDVKAANLLRGRKKGFENRIYLLDMGLATKFMTREGHRKEAPDPKKAHNGTIEFTSRDSHRGTPCTRRSDLETLGYNLILWLSGTLPWLGQTNVIQVAKVKEDSMRDVRKFTKTVFSNKVPPGIVDYLTYVTRLEFEETPNYDFLRKTLTSAIQSQGLKVDGVLSFSQARDTRSVAEPTSSIKENIVKPSAAPKAAARTKRKREKTPITLEPGVTPTPAMLEILKRNK